MEMPKLTEAHRRLERLAGCWSGEERMFPSPWDPEGGVALARINNRLALDGFVIVQDYEQERGNVITFQGHGVLRWDATEQCYVMHWFDSMGMPPNEFRGNFEADVLTLTNKEAYGWHRVVFNFCEERRYTFRMQVSEDGQQWSTLVEGDYRVES